MSKILIIFSLLFSVTSVAEEEAREDYGESLIRKYRGIDIKGNVWWVAPKNPTWTKLTFHLLKGASKEKFLEDVKSSKYNDKGGSYYGLEISFDNQDKAVGKNGFFVINQGGKFFGFRVRETMVDPKAVEPIEIEAFTPADSVFKWVPLTKKIGYGGILVKDKISSYFNE